MQRMHFKPRRHCYDDLFLTFWKTYAVRLFWTQFCFKDIAQSELFLIKRYPAVFTGSDLQPSSSQKDRGSLSSFSHFYSHFFFSFCYPFPDLQPLLWLPSLSVSPSPSCNLRFAGPLRLSCPTSIYHDLHIPAGIADFQRVIECVLPPFDKSGPYVSFFRMQP